MTATGRGVRPRLGGLLLALALVMHGLAPRDLAAQGLTGGRIQEAFSMWLSAVDHHAAGEDDDAVLEIARWTASDLDAIRWELSRHATRDAYWTRVRKRAALLHSHIGILVHQRMDQSSPQQNRPIGRSAAVVTDGQTRGYRTTNSHWAHARALLEHVHPPAAQDEGVREWYRATAGWLAEAGDLAELRNHLVHGRGLFRGDAVLTMMEGARRQALASARIQASLGSRSGRTTVGSRRHELSQARADLRDALRHDAGLVEARVRLGRVLADLERPQEAARELKLAVTQADQPVMLYHAWLSLGEQEAVLDRIAEATSAFERARALFPAAQSPHLALSQLARARGDRAAALESLHSALRPGASASDDPWSSFLWAVGGAWRERLDAVRRAWTADAP
jgi:tetratricopeptide (TPR) repeat protein